MERVRGMVKVMGKGMVSVKVLFMDRFMVLVNFMDMV
jgi:hypothetical protein